MFRDATKAPTVCPKDGALLREDLDFAHDAREEHIEIRRFVGVCGHGLIVGPEVEARGWRPQAESPRRCICGVALPGIGRRQHGIGVRRCRSCRHLPENCIACGQPMSVINTRKTCSEACLHAVASSTGRLALAKLHERRAS